MNIKFLDHYALGVIFAPSVCICHLTLVNNKMYFVLKFTDPSRSAITTEEKYCLKPSSGLCFSSPCCHLRSLSESQDLLQRAMLSLHGFPEGPEEMTEGSTALKAMRTPLPMLLKRRQRPKGRWAALQGSSLSECQACQREQAALLGQRYNWARLEQLWLFNRVAWANSQKGSGREETTEEKSG